MWYFDMIMHFLGGLWLGFLFLYILPHQEHPTSFSSVIKTLLFVFFIGIGWEIYEIVVNDVIAQNPFNILDTISDLFFDLTGGALSILYYVKRIMLVEQNTIQ